MSLTGVIEFVSLLGDSSMSTPKADLIALTWALQLGTLPTG